jgi:hypothetical protein
MTRKRINHKDPYLIYSHYRSNKSIVEEIISHKNIILVLKNGSRVVVPGLVKYKRKVILS